MSLALKIRKILNETLESKWNEGNYNYQHGYCHYFAYDIIDKIKKIFPNLNIKFIFSQNLGHTFGTLLLDYNIFNYCKTQGEYDYIWKFSNDVIALPEAAA